MNEKEQYYFRRTLEHIQRVQRNALFLIEHHSEELNLSLEDCRQLMENVLLHDRSKFCEAQFLPYLEFSWNKKQDPKGAYYLGDAWKDHYTKENHHSEKYRGKLNSMTKLNLIEVVCDLQAMSQEFNEGNCRNYFENVWKRQHAEDFHDDYDWFCVVLPLMDQCIKCFEKQEVLPELKQVFQ